MGLDSVPVSHNCRNNFNANKVNVINQIYCLFVLCFLKYKYCLVSSVRSVLK